MLSRPHRLRSRQDFQQVYREGRSWAHPLLALHVRAVPGGQRVGISVSRKVGKAVSRNRVRRRLREAVRLLLPGWRSGVDVILVARAAAAEAPYPALGAAVAELARRARLSREPEEAPGTLYKVPERRDGPSGRGARR